MCRAASTADGKDGVFQVRIEVPLDGPAEMPRACGCCWWTTRRWPGPGCAPCWPIAATPAAQVVAEAATAAQALAWLQHERADLALLDIQMPGADGLALAQALRACPSRQPWCSSPPMATMRCGPSSSRRWIT
jgi:CheY-like chemotaxis protein